MVRKPPIPVTKPPTLPDRTVAILNRVDHSQSNFIEELRAMRTQQESVRKRVETLEHNG